MTTPTMLALTDLRNRRNPHGLRFLEGEDGRTPTPADVAATTGAAGSTSTAPANGGTEPTRLPDDHPLVTAYARQKQENEALREKAARLDDIEAAQKSDAEKQAEELAEARAEVEKIPATVTDLLRTHLVGLHQISDEDAELYLTATTPDLLLKQVDRYVELSKAGGRVGVVPTQGTANPQGAQVSAFELGRERALARYQKQN